jgi:primosomal replication protein N
MTRYTLAGLVVTAGLLAAGVPLLAHHSFEAEYDFNKPVKLSGTVTKMEWMNPHAHFYIDVKDDNGAVTNWNCELGAIPVLLKQGWRKDSLKAGDQVTVEGFLAKDGTKGMANARRVTLPDGRRVFGGSSAPAGNQ